MTKITLINYNRKSTDTEDKQVLSLESQKTEIQNLAAQRDLKIDITLEEAKSAKKPGRPIFNQMIETIQKEKNQCSIICWHANRLTRNMPDMATIIELLESGKLISIITPGQTFKNNPMDKFMFSFWCIQAKLDNDNKSVDIARGMKTRAMKGYYPVQAPPGYTENKAKHPDDLKKIKDENFSLLRKCIDLILSRNYTPAQTLEIMSKEWKLTTRYGNKMNKNTFYNNFLKNPFYYGEYEWPRGSGNWVKGSHEPMMTKAEWLEVQSILEDNRKKPIKPQEKEFTFGNCILKCGECNSVLVAYDTVKKQKNGVVRSYVYNECKANKNCSQKCIEDKILTEQTNQYLGLIEIPSEIHELAMSWVKRENENQSKDTQNIVDNLTRRYKTVLAQLDGLVDALSSKIITPEKYNQKNKEYTLEADEIKRKIDSYHIEKNDWYNLANKMFTFAEYSKKCFEKGDVKMKRAIIRALSSELVVLDKKLIIPSTSWIYPLQILANEVKSKKTMFEPEISIYKKDILSLEHTSSLLSTHKDSNLGPSP